VYSGWKKTFGCLQGQVESGRARFLGPLHFGQHFQEFSGFGVHEDPETPASLRRLRENKNGLVTSTAEEFFQVAGRFCIILLEGKKKFFPLPVILVEPDMIVLQEQIILTSGLGGDLDEALLG
jgi:hypothetical protein